MAGGIEDADILICFNCHKPIVNDMLFYSFGKGVYCENCPQFKQGGLEKVTGAELYPLD